MSKQTLLKQTANWVDLAQLGAAPATPAAATNRLYVDANGLLQLTSPTGAQPSRRLVTDWGVGTAFPTTGLGRGDVYTHSGIGAMFLWNGAAWRQATTINANTFAILQTTATTYGALLHDGVRAYVTGLKVPFQWDAAGSVFRVAGDLTLGEGNLSITGAEPVVAQTPSWTDLATVTATSYGGPVAVRWLGALWNGGSGTDRTGQLQVTCDGTALATSATASIPIGSAGSASNGPRVTKGGTVTHTPAAGSHTWKVQGNASAASAVISSLATLTVVEKPQ